MLNQGAPSSNPNPKTKAKAKPKDKAPKGKAKAKAKAGGEALPAKGDLQTTVNQMEQNQKVLEEKLRESKARAKAARRQLSNGQYRMAVGVADNGNTSDVFGQDSIVAAPAHASPLNP